MNLNVKKLIVVVILVIIGIELFLLVGPQIKSPNDAHQSIEVLAGNIVNKCSSVGTWQSCYEEEVPKYMSAPFNLSMEKAFELTKAVQHQDTKYEYCHVLGHKLSAVETKKDPDKWKDVITRCPSGVCSNGCIHGAFQERFRTESLPNATIEELNSELGDVCEPRGEWKPTGLEQGSCYHALGHLLMYITNADIHKSLQASDAVCKKADGRDYTQLCYDGAFMQIYQPLEAEDFALIKGKEVTKQQHESFCNQFDPQAKSSCWSEGWPLHFEEIKTPQGLVTFCTGLSQSDEHINRCFDSLYYVITPQLQFSETKIVNFCNQMPPRYKQSCFANAATRMIETDWENVERSVAVCNDAHKLGFGQKCFDELVFFASYNFRPNSEEFVSLCNKLPGEWANRCLKK